CTTRSCARTIGGTQQMGTRSRHPPVAECWPHLALSAVSAINSAHHAGVPIRAGRARRDRNPVRKVMKRFVRPLLLTAPIVALSACAPAAGPAPAGGAPPAASMPSFEVPVEYHTLDN